MLLTSDIFSDIQTYIKDSISAVRYVSNDGIGIAEIRTISMVENGAVRVEIAIEKNNIKITEMLLYGKNGHLWAKQNTDITLSMTYPWKSKWY